MVMERRRVPHGKNVGELFQNCTYPCNKLFLKNRKIMALLKFLLSGNENKKKGR
jgi:hypothetical protein